MVIKVTLGACPAPSGSRLLNADVTATKEIVNHRNTSQGPLGEKEHATAFRWLTLSNALLISKNAT